MNAKILQGDVFQVLPTIEAGSVDAVVTSPPYWALRSYLPKGHPLKHLELGQEPSPAEYVRRIVDVFRLVRATMADHATLWINCGDTYAGGGGFSPNSPSNIDNARGVTNAVKSREFSSGSRNPKYGIDAGNLCLIPQRLMIALQDDGWLVRSVVVWHKPAPMPSSVSGWMWKKCRVKTKGFWSKDNPHPSKRGSGGMNCGVENSGGFKTSASWSDCPGCKRCSSTDGFVLRRGSWRPTSAWEPVIMLAKTSDYYADGEAVKTPPAEATVSRDAYTRILDDPDEEFAVKHDHETVCDSGANLRDVWKIAAEPLKEKHYAAYPSELVYRCLAAATSAAGYCKDCGKPWVRVVEQGPSHYAMLGKTARDDVPEESKSPGLSGSLRLANGTVPSLHGASTETLGWRASCPCGAETRPGLVLDPFAGSGRTAIVSGRLQLDSIGVELNSEYVNMSKKLIKADAPLFNTVGG